MGSQPVERVAWRAGLLALWPGAAQWRVGEPERATLFLGGFVSSMAVAALAWGTPLGLAMLGVAFVTHAASACDALRESAFPGFARGVPTLSAALAIGLLGYAPGFWLAWSLASPEGRRDGTEVRYLVNRLAYGPEAPAPGDRVFFRGPAAPGGQIGRVVAGSGQEIAWRDGRLLVDGRPLGWPLRLLRVAPRELEMTVPPDALLMAIPPDAAASSCGLLLISRDEVVGRAWARIYPVWSRRLI